MKPAFDLTSVRLLLRQGIDKGHWTLEHLDTPPLHWQENSKQFRLNYPKYQQHEYVNPLRDPEPLEAVEPTSPRDFVPAAGPTPAEAPALPLTLEQPPAAIDEDYGF